MGTYQQNQVEVLKNLTKDHLPMNDFGLPVGIYRVDLLPFDDYEPNTPDHLATPTTPTTPTTTDTKQLPWVNEDAEVLELEPEPELEPDTDTNNSVTTIGLDTDNSIEGSLPGDGRLPEEPQSQSHLLAPQRIAGLPAANVHNAYMELGYDEGYPTQPDGTPFWEKLIFEPPDAHAIFVRYLQMSQGQRGYFGSEEEEAEEGTAASGERGIIALASAHHDDDHDLIEAQEKYIVYSHLYYWGLRTKAYDFYRVAAHRKQQELRAIETQDEQYLDSRRLMAKLRDFMNDTEEFWDQMTPKTAIDMYKMLMGLQRISAGLPVGGPATTGTKDGDGSSKPGASMEIMLRSIAQSNNPQGATYSEDGQELLDKALDDPEMVDQMQELIIRINTGGK